MAYQVLARKYRPQKFSDVVGQDHVTRTLMNALSQGRVAHGYIFSGHRGIGKTTIARIVAMALNCQREIGSPERPTPEPCGLCINCKEISAASRTDVSIFEESHSFDVEEIDAATRRGIDDAKLLTSKILARPSNKSKYKILILDEAHQITDAAWNALLKTLEEPPEWAVFMFATTQPEDIPQTVRSRCQHFSFHAVKLDDILSQLRMVCEKEGVLADEAALSLLAEAGDGSMRDALSIMDQAIASAPVENGRTILEASQIRELMGTVPNAVFEQVLESISANQTALVLTEASRLLDAGNSPAQLARQFVRYLRNCLVAKIAGVTPEKDASELLQISPDERKRAARSAMLFSEEDLARFLQVMLRTFDELGYRQEQRFHFELGLVKLVHLQRLLPVEELLSGIPLPSSSKAAQRLPSGSTHAGNLSRPAPTAAAQARPTASVPVGNPGSAGSAARTAAVVSSPASSPAFSPFEADRNRKGTASQANASQVAADRGNAIQKSAIQKSAIQDSAIQDIAIQDAAIRDVATRDVAFRDSAIQNAETQGTSPRDYGQAGRPKTSGDASSSNAAKSPVSSVTARQTEQQYDLTSGALALAAIAEALPAPIQAAAMAEPLAQTFGLIDVESAAAGSEVAALEVAALEIPALEAESREQVTEPPLQAGSAVPPAASVPAAATAEDAGSPASDGFNLEALQNAVCDALTAGSQQSLADQLGEATWSIEGSQLKVQTAMTKTILGILFNGNAEKIAKDALRQNGGGALKLTLLPGDASLATAAPKKPRAARTGSAQARALEHPLVQQAQRLFNAEIRNVVDLREKE